jgi:Polyketide cyclase / dehydrase and lipid transport
MEKGKQVAMFLTEEAVRLGPPGYAEGGGEHDLRVRRPCGSGWQRRRDGLQLLRRRDESHCSSRNGECLMSCYRQQAQLDAPASAVWELVGNVERHPEWWPRVIDVQCDGLDEGCMYRQVYKSPIGVIETDVSVERLEDCRELLLRCLDTGTYTRWLVTEAQGGTFIDAEFGLDPKKAATRVFDVVAGRRYFRRWLDESIAGLRRAAREGVPA